MKIDAFLTDFKNGLIDLEEMKIKLAGLQTQEMEDVVVDLQREARCGLPEVVYGKGKTVEQIVNAAKMILENSGCVLITRVEEDLAGAVLEGLPECDYSEKGRAIYKLGERKIPGKVLILTAGTSDVTVAEEAKLTCSMFGVDVEVKADVGVAGLHRLLKIAPELQKADCIIVCAGMEGALPSVVGGLVSVPIIAVPVSSGYGSALSGGTALLGMLNSCASGLTVVNIDNGFGAGYAAGRIVKMLDKKAPQ